MAISCRILSVATIGGRPDWLGPVSRREGSAPRGAGMGNGPHPCAHASREPILMGLTGGFVAMRRATSRFKNTALRFQNISPRRATSLQTHPRQPLMGRGRGNLRENREDPAPTVGICGDIIAIQMLSHCRRHAHTMHPACCPPMGTLRFLQQRGTPHRYGLREIELRD